MTLGNEKDPPKNHYEDTYPEYFKTEHDVIEKYKEVPFGAVISVPISMLEPTQKHDGRVNESPKPIPVFMTTSRKDETKGKVVLRLIEGNHRYYNLLEKGETHIMVEKSRNPEY
jgi:hypothetical protein